MCSFLSTFFSGYLKEKYLKIKYNSFFLLTEKGELRRCENNFSFLKAMARKICFGTTVCKV